MSPPLAPAVKGHQARSLQKWAPRRPAARAPDLQEAGHSQAPRPRPWALLGAVRPWAQQHQTLWPGLTLAQSTGPPGLKSPQTLPSAWNLGGGGLWEPPLPGTSQGSQARRNGLLSFPVEGIRSVRLPGAPEPSWAPTASPGHRVTLGLGGWQGGPAPGTRTLEWLLPAGPRRSCPLQPLDVRGAVSLPPTPAKPGEDSGHSDGRRAQPQV